MPFAMTYDSLVNSIQTYAERTDSTFVGKIPEFIMLAENRIASEIHGLGFRRVVTGAFGVGNPVIDKPVRWRETAEFSFMNVLGQRVYVKQRAYDYLRMYWPDQSLTGTPAYYADYDYEHFLIAPTPDAALTFELQYHERPDPLDSTNQTSWTTRYAPQLLLYASLLEAQTFLMRPDQLQSFLGLYQNAAQAIQKEAERRVIGDEANTRKEG